MPRIPTFSAACTRSLLILFEPNKTLYRLVREAHQSFRTTRRKRPKINRKTRSKPLGAPQAFGRPTGEVLDVFGVARAGFWTAPGRSWLARGRLWDGIWVSKSRPDRVRTRPRNGLGRPTRIKFNFSLIFGWIWDGFSSIFE